MGIFRRLLTVASLMLLALVWSAPTHAQDNLIDTIKKRGKLTVGFGTFVPWAMRDKQGNWIGFEIDVSTKIAKDIGVELDLMPSAWDAIIPSLIAGKFDVIIGGMTITPARKEQVDFTDPYAQSGLGIAASKQLAAKLKWPDEYNNTSVTFVCRRGSTPCKYIEDKWPKATLRQFDDQAVAYQEVINGNAHAMIGNEPLPTFKVRQNPDRLFKPTSDTLGALELEGMGFKKGNPSTIRFFNEWIAKNQGWLMERHTYWFKGQDWLSLVP